MEPGFCEGDTCGRSGCTHGVIKQTQSVLAGYREDVRRLESLNADLLEACQTFSAWLEHEEGGFDHHANDRDTPQGEAAWREWWGKGQYLCALAQERARTAIAKATGGQNG